MAFLQSFFKDVIKRNMEDPAERDAHNHAVIIGKKKQAAKLRETWYQTLKPWGFWKNDFSNAKYYQNLDPAVKRQPGREGDSLS